MITAVREARSIPKSWRPKMHRSGCVIGTSFGLQLRLSQNVAMHSLLVRLKFPFPQKLDRGQRIELLHGFVQREFVDGGMIADVAVHEGKTRDSDGQPHVHVMLTTREMTDDGSGKKTAVGMHRTCFWDGTKHR